MMRNLKVYLSAIVIAFSTLTGSAKSHKKHSTHHSKKIELKSHTGTATYYGDRYGKGRKTASGKRFDKNKATAAHRTLPFGTIVLVTNKKTGKSVKVEITDRGPFTGGHIIDLTPVAFKQIGELKSGVLQVELKILEMPKA